MSFLQWFYATNKIESKATWNDLLYTYLGNYLFTRFINETYIFDNEMYLFKYSGKNNLCFIFNMFYMNLMKKNFG